MSRFRIYRINDPDPKIIGKDSRRTIWIPSLIAIGMIIIICIYILFFSPDSSQPLFFSIPVIMGLAIYISIKHNLAKQKITTIGEIEFTQTGIIKRIGHSSTHYYLELIKEIELHRHIIGSIFESKSGNISYILIIIQKDSTKESLIVSDNTLEANQNTSIVDTLKTLKRLHPNILFKFVQ
jgi:hypothetical protein